MLKTRVIPCLDVKDGQPPCHEPLREQEQKKAPRPCHELLREQDQKRIAVKLRVIGTSQC